MPHGTANGTFVVVPVLFNQSIRVIDYSSDVFASIETSRGPNFQKKKKGNHLVRNKKADQIAELNQIKYFTFYWRRRNRSYGSSLPQEIVADNRRFPED